MRTMGSGILEAEGILEFGRQLGIGGGEPKVAEAFVDPALIEGNEEVAAGVQCPAHAALPTQVLRSIVVLAVLSSSVSRSYIKSL